jgi:hypothetical protein
MVAVQWQGDSPLTQSYLKDAQLTQRTKHNVPHFLLVQILRFFAFSVEQVLHSPLEEVRIRR